MSSHHVLLDKVENTDAIIINAIEDWHQANEFRNYLMDNVKLFQDKRENESVKPRIKLINEILGPDENKFASIFKIAFDKTNYIFLFATKFLLEKKSILSKLEPVLFQNSERKSCIIPVNTKNRKSKDYDLGVYEGVKPIEYWSKDTFLVSSIQKLLKQKVEARLKRDKESESNKKIIKDTHFQSHCQNQPVSTYQRVPNESSIGSLEVDSPISVSSRYRNSPHTAPAPNPLFSQSPPIAYGLSELHHPCSSLRSNLQSSTSSQSTYVTSSVQAEPPTFPNTNISGSHFSQHFEAQNPSDSGYQAPHFLSHGLSHSQKEQWQKLQSTGSYSQQHSAIKFQTGPSHPQHVPKTCGGISDTSDGTPQSSPEKAITVYNIIIQGVTNAAIGEGAILINNSPSDGANFKGKSSNFDDGSNYWTGKEEDQEGSRESERASHFMKSAGGTITTPDGPQGTSQHKSEGSSHSRSDISGSRVPSDLDEMYVKTTFSSRENISYHQTQVKQIDDNSDSDSNNETEVKKVWRQK